MNYLDEFDKIMFSLDEALKKIDNNDLEQADKYLEQASNGMKDLGIYE